MAARLAAIRIMHGWRQSRGAAVPCRRDANRARREVKKDPTSTRTPLLQSQLLLYLLLTEQSLSQHIYRRPLVSPRLQHAMRTATRASAQARHSDRCRANRQR